MVNDNIRQYRDLGGAQICCIQVAHDQHIECGSECGESMFVIILVLNVLWQTLLHDCKYQTEPEYHDDHEQSEGREVNQILLESADEVAGFRETSECFDR